MSKYQQNTASCVANRYWTVPSTDRATSVRRRTVKTDAGEYNFVQQFPARSPARTTFHAREANDEQKWNRRWKYQHGRGQTNDGAGKTRVRQDAYTRRCKAILCQCEVPEYARSEAIDRVFRENLNRFSRHYGGYDGACVGFALLAMFDEPEPAKESFFANRASTVLKKQMKKSVEDLINYTFREYGGDDSV